MTTPHDPEAENARLRQQLNRANAMLRARAVALNSICGIAGNNAYRLLSAHHKGTVPTAPDDPKDWDQVATLAYTALNYRPRKAP